VEDSTADVELALEALNEFQLANEVFHVADGAEALDYVYRRGNFANHAKGHPAVVLLDLKMPRVDGTAVLKKLKSDPDLKQIPVIVMTSSREERDMVSSYALGANAYVVKPLNFHDFMDTVKYLGLFWVVVNQPPPGSVARPPTGRLYSR
jgi:CheY-like chemotaxis protein